MTRAPEAHLRGLFPIRSCRWCTAPVFARRAHTFSTNSSIGAARSAMYYEEMDEQQLPMPDKIREQIRRCREELKALKTLLRVAVALQQADAARQWRGESDATR